MSLYGSFLSDDQFQCSICLDVFTNPSSTPCGHSFCMGCITRYWDGSKVCQCPLCKKSFQKRPELQINRTLREITEQFKSMSGKVTRRASIGGRATKGGGGGGGGRGWEAGPVLFDELKKKLPRGQKTPAVNIPSESQSQGNPFVTSCSPVSTEATPLLASSVPNQSPLAAMVQAQSLNHGAGPPPPLPPPHHPYPGRRRFTVTALDTSANVPLCEVHRRGILVYCRTDRVCICPECETLDHRDHDTVSVETEWQEQKALLSASEQNTEVMIKLRVQKIEEIRMSVSELEVAVEREAAGSGCVLGAMVRAVERSRAELQQVMEMSRRAAEHQADALIRQLELEVGELRRRGHALAELTQSEDHIHCVKSFPALSVPPPTRDWSGVSVNSDLGTGTVYRSLAVQVERFQQELKNVAEIGFPVSALESSPVRTSPKLKRIQDYAVDMTLDSNTAHPRLVLSEDMKQVKCGERHQLVPDNPERFDRVVCVLGRNAISSGKHYWEVEVGGKTDWDLGVASQSISRKGKVDVNPCNGYWFLSLRDKNKYAFRTEPSTEVPLSLRPQKIGVFVDYDKGQVSFYNVDAKIHIFTFTDTFTEGIYGFFSPCTNKSGKNDAPLTITPVNMID